LIVAAAKGSQHLELPPLGYKKWGLREQAQAFDHVTLGTYTPNVFDQMQAASVVCRRLEFVFMYDSDLMLEQVCV